MKELKVSQKKRKTAETLAKSLAIPFVDCSREINVEKLLSLRSKFSDETGKTLKLDACFLKCIAEVVKENLELMNLSWMEGENGPKILAHDELNLGLAMVSKNDELVVATIKNVGAMTLKEINDAVATLREKAKKGVFDLEDFNPPANIALNNAGALDLDRGSSLPQPHQVMMLSTYAIRPRAVVENSAVVVRSMMEATLTFDHRPFNGSLAAKFLKTFKEKIENPVF